MSCSECRHWKYTRLKEGQAFGECVGMYPDEVVYVYAEYSCPMFKANAKTKFTDAMIKLGETIRLSWGR